MLNADVARLFFAEVYDLSRQEGWASDEHFTADGTLIESWAGLKSFVRKDGGDDAKVQSSKDEDPGNPSVNFRGEQRRNDTHRSTTDPDSVLYRKAQGKEARLCFGGHILMENRHGLCADFTLHNPITASEPMMAVQQIDAHAKLHPGVKVKTVGADKGYHQKGFITACRKRGIAPHVACKKGVNLVGAGRADDHAARLSDQPAHPQAGGGNLWMDQDGGRIEEEPLPGTGADAGVGLFRGRDLQPAALGATGRGDVNGNGTKAR